MCIYIITDDIYLFKGLEGIMRQNIRDIFIHIHSDKLFSYFKHQEIVPEDVFILASDCVSLNMAVLLFLKNTSATILLAENKNNRTITNYLPSAVIRKNATTADILLIIGLEQKRDRDSIFAKITERERAVLLYTMTGKSLKYISNTMKVSLKTIYAHRKKGLSKLGARSVMDFGRMQSVFPVLESKVLNTH